MVIFATAWLLTVLFSGAALWGLAAGCFLNGRFRRAGIGGGPEPSERPKAFLVELFSAYLPLGAPVGIGVGVTLLAVLVALSLAGLFSWLVGAPAAWASAAREGATRLFTAANTLAQIVAFGRATPRATRFLATRYFAGREAGGVSSGSGGPGWSSPGRSRSRRRPGKGSDPGSGESGRKNSRARQEQSSRHQRRTEERKRAEERYYENARAHWRARNGGGDSDSSSGGSGEDWWRRAKEKKSPSRLAPERAKALRALGLDPSRPASTQKIKTAWRRKAAECHPDRFAGADASTRKKKRREFQRAQNAFEYLSATTAAGESK